MYQIGRNLIDKYLTTLSFLFIIFSLLIILIAPSATSYEISIYQVYPWYFWLFILTSIFLGQLIIFKEIFNDTLTNQNNHNWLLGIISILIPIIILLLLPVMRGYPTYNTGDHFYQIGEIKDILQYKNIGQDVFYPNLHILTASLILVTGDGLINFVNIIPRFFFFVLFITLFLFYRSTFKNDKEIKFAFLISSSFLFFGMWFMDLFPFYQSLSLMPMIMYLYFKRDTLNNSTSYSILFLILVTSFIFYHPLNSLLLILVFLILAIILYLPKKIMEIKIMDTPGDVLKTKSINIVFFSVLLFFIWYLSFSSIIGYFNKVFQSIFFGTYESIFQKQVAIYYSYSPSLLDTIRVIVYTYGAYFLISFISLICLLYFFVQWFRNKKSIELKYFLILSTIIFLFLNILSAGSIFSDFIVDLPRFMTWSTIYSFILITITIFHFYSGLEKNKIRTKCSLKIISILLLGLFLSLTYLSIFTFYPSPIIGSGYVNPQVTEMEWKGSEWFNNYINRQITTNEVGITLWRYSYAIYGLKKSQELYPSGEISKPPPDHFGYNNKTSLGESFNDTRYLVITYLGRIRYPESYPNYKNLWRFTPDDFNRLQNDSTVNKLYENGGFETYLVRPNHLIEK